MRIGCWYLLAASCVAAALSSCSFNTGDSAARISGTISIEGRGAPEACRLELLDRSGSQVLDYRSVQSHFLATFVLPPQAQEYVLRISCVGAETFTSRATLLGGQKTSYDTTVNLGTIVLRAR